MHVCVKNMYMSVITVIQVHNYNYFMIIITIIQLQSLNYTQLINYISFCRGCACLCVYITHVRQLRFYHMFYPLYACCIFVVESFCQTCHVCISMRAQ